MKLQTKIELLKFCSLLLSFIFMALGVSVGGCGLWILYDQSFVSVITTEELYVVALALLSVGGLVLVVGALGWVGTQKESRLLLLLVSAVLTLLVFIQVFITLLLVMSRTKISDTVEAAVRKLIQNYPTEQPRLLDDMQHYAKCCGYNGSIDWQKNPFVQNHSKAEVLPCSCFSSNVTRHEAGAFCSDNLTLISNDILYANASYSQGCEAALTIWLRENLFTIIGMDLGLILIQLLQLAVLVNLFRSFGLKSSVKSSDPDGPEPDQDLDLDQAYTDQDLLHQDADQGLYHGPYDGPYGEPNPDYRQYRQ